MHHFCQCTISHFILLNWDWHTALSDLHNHKTRDNNYQANPLTRLLATGHQCRPLPHSMALCTKRLEGWLFLWEINKDHIPFNLVYHKPPHTKLLQNSKRPFGLTYPFVSGLDTDVGEYINPWKGGWKHNREITSDVETPVAPSYAFTRGSSKEGLNKRTVMAQPHTKGKEHLPLWILFLTCWWLTVMTIGPWVM